MSLPSTPYGVAKLLRQCANSTEGDTVIVRTKLPKDLADVLDKPKGDDNDGFPMWSKDYD